MTLLQYTTAQNDRDLLGIMILQQQNLLAGISSEEATGQGFVTVIHTLDILRKMNAIEQHIICKDNETVIAYLLAMTTNSKNDLPVLIPMFDLFDEVEYKGRLVSTYAYLVVGQVCVAKGYRGQGILDKTYQHYRDTYQPKYDFAITEIATRNTRSIQAHKRVGFIEMARYISPEGEEWSIVLWDWRQVMKNEK